ncbi:MAG: PHP domain-containing protein, partial [Planktomarina sp.]
MIEVNRTHRPVEAFRRDILETYADENGYAELCVTTNFTFLTGASHPEELITRAADLGLSSIAITDKNSLAGVVRAWSALKELHREAQNTLPIRSHQEIDSSSRQQIGNQQGIDRPQVLQLPRLIVGCRLVLQDSLVHFVALPTDRPAYKRLTRMLTAGKRRAQKGECHLFLKDV